MTKLDSQMKAETKRVLDVLLVARCGDAANLRRFVCISSALTLRGPLFYLLKDSCLNESQFLCIPLNF